MSTDMWWSLAAEYWIGHVFNINGCLYRDQMQ